jgi:hypothetical protein
MRSNMVVDHMAQIPLHVYQYHCSTFKNTLLILHVSIFTTNLAFSFETSTFQNEHYRQILGMKKEPIFSHYITKILISQTSFKDFLINIQKMHASLGIKCIKHNVLLGHYIA